MQQVQRKLAALILLTLCLVSTAFATSRTRYTTEVQLHDGKHVVCAVNQPLPTALSSDPALTIDERNEAEIDATAGLRQVFRSQTHYPDPGTAPRVLCS
ncbi:hypothetical protein [Paraburkholderia gardini]|uniref:Uncharacterized protein n=1 Tax=Paraburkholderia gardini TaxID=2823469 RepID=A0ABM8U8V0_9BURK|nr:hypothetical protein [Paraburkholderia gardini]CAG4890535.1 hypothetical protein R69919_00960 [Paraburkholderia gardini]CAG4917223.1 hypothetical protein R54767_04383 [Paraburkholderia gardini]